MNRTSSTDWEFEHHKAKKNHDSGLTALPQTHFYYSCKSLFKRVPMALYLFLLAGGRSPGAIGVHSPTKKYSTKKEGPLFFVAGKKLHLANACQFFTK